MLRSRWTEGQKNSEEEVEEEDYWERPRRWEDYEEYDGDQYSNDDEFTHINNGNLRKDRGRLQSFTFYTGVLVVVSLILFWFFIKL